MRTSGKGNDLLIIVIPGGILVAFVMWMYGGPSEFFKALNSMLRDLTELVSGLVSSLF